MKTYTNVDENSTTTNVPDIAISGNPYAWKCLCKASSDKEQWMKSTKVMNIPGGCLVQVTTQQGDNVAEALTYIPNIHIKNGNLETII